MAKLKTIRANVNINTTLAAATTTTYSLLTASDSPNPALVSDNSTIAQCENNSIIGKTHLQLVLVPNAQITDPIQYSFVLWKDRVNFGAPADPASALDVLQPSTTSALSVFKANVAMFRRNFLSASGDKHTYYLKIPRRLRIMKEGDILKLTITNSEAATDAIEFFVSGYIAVRQG